MGNFENDVKDAMRRGPDIDVGDVPMVTESDGSDIFDAVNNKLAELGPDTAVWVSPQRYTRANGKAVTTQLQPQSDDQMVHFWGGDIELADGVDQDPVRITRDGFEIIQLNIKGNRANNSINAALNTDSGLSGILLQNVEFDNAPVGLLLNGIEDSTVAQCRSDEGASNLGTGFLLDQCEEVNFLGNNARAYQDVGMELRRCESMIVRGIIAQSAADSTANQALLLKGTTNSEVEGSLDLDGDTTEGLVSETFDPGGANETVSAGNEIELSIDGAQETAIRVSDSESETLDITVDGDYDGGRTTKVFDFNSPNGINTPRHDARINSRNTTRITDTNVTANNAGVLLELILSRVTNTDSITLAGESLITTSFGIGTPNPTLQVGADTSLNTRRQTRREQTNGSGQVTLDWSDSFAFTDKPSIVTNIEQAGQSHIASYTTDGSGRFTGATIQVTDSSGTAVGSGVSVIGRLIGT